MNHVAVSIWEEIWSSPLPALPGDAELGERGKEACLEHGTRVLTVRKATLKKEGESEQKQGVVAITDTSVLFFPGSGRADNVPVVWRGVDVEMITTPTKETNGQFKIGTEILTFEKGMEKELENSYRSGCKGTEFPLYDLERTKSNRTEERSYIMGQSGVYLSGMSDLEWRKDAALIQDLSVKHSVELRKQLIPGMHEITCANPVSLVLPLFIPVIFERIIDSAERRLETYAAPKDSVLIEVQLECRKTLIKQRDEARELHKKAIELGKFVFDHETELFVDEDLKSLGYNIVKGGEVVGLIEPIADKLWEITGKMRTAEYASQNRHILVETMELHNHVLDILRGLRLRAEAIIFNTWADLFFARRFEPAKRLLDVSYGTCSYNKKSTVTRGITYPHYASLCRLAAEVADQLAAIENTHAVALIPRVRVNTLVVEEDTAIFPLSAEFHPQTNHGAILRRDGATSIIKVEPEDMFSVRGRVAEPLEGALTSEQKSILVEMTCSVANVYVCKSEILQILVSYKIHRKGTNTMELTPDGECPFGSGSWFINTGKDSSEASIVWKPSDETENSIHGWKGPAGIPVPALLYLTHFSLTAEGREFSDGKSKLFRRMLDVSVVHKTFALQTNEETTFNKSRLATYDGKKVTHYILERELVKALAESFGSDEKITAPIPASAEQLEQIETKRTELKNIQEEIIMLRQKLSQNTVISLPTLVSESINIDNVKEDRTEAEKLLALLEEDIASLQRLQIALTNVF